MCLPCTYHTPTENCRRRNSNSTYPRAYPRPHISSKSQPGGDETSLPYTARISFRQCQIRQPENRPPDRPNLSCLPCTYPGPPSLWPAREPTSNWTKANQPTLDRIHHTSSTGRPSNRSSNRPCPSSLPCTVQHTTAHDRASHTRRNRIPPSLTRLPCTARPETTHRKNPQPLQVSRNPENPLGKSRRRTAYPQQIVTTRLLYCLQDRFAQLSRLQRI